jgi:Bacterial Ig domain/Glycosyl hydrolase catalytic core
MRRRVTARFFLGLGLLSALIQTPHAAAPGVISIDFVGAGGAMAASETAGVVAKSNWNGAAGASRATPQSLVDETGAASGATVTWTSNSTWSTPITDAAGSRRMMKGYLDTSATTTTTVTVAGLSTAAYDVYVYVDGDNSTDPRAAAYKISGPGITTTTVNLTDAAGTNFSGAFTQASGSNGNYVKFSITAAGFTLSATPGAANVNKRAPVNGIQIVPTGPPSPDFSIAASPASTTVTQGAGTSYTVTVGALNGFSGTVNLGVSGAPVGTMTAFTPSSVSGAGTATLDISTGASTPAGSVTLAIAGTSGTLTHSTTVTFVVNAPPPPPDFSMSAAPPARSVAPGGVTTYNVTVGPLNGFAGTVSFGATGLPAGASASFSPLTVTASGSTTMTVTTDGGTPTGTSTVTITGTSGAVTHSATASLSVSTAPATRVISIDFVGSGTAMAATESAGVVPRTNWNSAPGASRATALALVDEAGAATSATATWTSNSTWATPITGQAGDARMMKGYLDTSDTSTTTVTVAGLAVNTYDVYVYADGDSATQTRTGGYRVSGTGITTTTINLNDAATNFGGAFTQANNSNGNYVKFTITAGGFTISAIPGASPGVKRAPVNGIQIVAAGPPTPDFTVAASPASRSVIQGSSTTYTATIGALNGFAGTVVLSVSGLPSNAMGTFSPTSVTGAGSSTLTVDTTATTPTGSPTLTITGTSGAVTRSGTVSLVVTGQTHSISGTITPATDGAGSTVSLGGAATGMTTANASGAYTFAGLANGAYAVSPSRNGFMFTPASRNVSVSGANVSGQDFTVAPSPNSISISAPAGGATVTNPFSISATASGGIVGVQFRVDGGNAGPEDTSAPFSASVTASSGSHTLTAVGRDGSGNTVTSAPVTVTVNAGSGTALTINGAQTFQTINGFGVNINSLSWKGGELIPALDMLADQLGATTWRVVFDMEDWESTNDNSDPAMPDWTYYNALYSNAKFQNLWGTLHYLNQKGISSGIVLSFMGRVPPWMGGSKITTTLEDEWVEMIATLLYYARNTEGVQFSIVDPINEPDWDGIEGPQVDQFQYARLLEKLSVRLDAMGLGDVKFVGPNTASIDTGVNSYMPQMMSNATVMSKVDHFGFHNYNGQTSGADSAIKSSAYSSRNFWMTELSIPEQIFTLVGQGASATQIWEAYDSVYNHAILAGRGSSPPNDAGNLPALLAYNSSTGVYTPRSQFFQASAFRFVPPGAVRVAATESNGSLTLYAFLHATTGRLVIVGRYTGGSSLAVNGSLSGVGSVASFQLYSSSISNNYSSFTRGADVVVTGESFTFTAPANSYFTLTTTP